MHTAPIRKALFCLCIAVCALPRIGTATALLAGIFFSLVLGNPWPDKTAKFSKIILQLSVVGLGFGLSLGEVLRTGKASIVYTTVGIALTMGIGLFLGRLWRTGRNTSVLISFGTAICGGSAIAAMAPVLKAKNEETAVALATIFTLNAIALLLFPLIGQALHLSQENFGIWAGLAIHDTSSVVGAASTYGAQALAVGTTVKLTRAIWITPLVIIASWLKKSGQKAGIPLFIIGFILAASIRTVLPGQTAYFNILSACARQCLVITLFLIGSGLSQEVLKRVGTRPLFQGVTLWLIISSLTLAALQLIGLT